MRRVGSPDHSSKTHRWTHESSVWGDFTRSYRTFRSLGSAERDSPRSPSQGGVLGTRSPTLDLSQNTDTGDQRLLEVPPDNGLSMTPTLHILTSLCKTRGSLSSIRLLV